MLLTPFLHTHSRARAHTHTHTHTGVAPPSIFFIRTGTTLYQLTTSSGHISIRSILILAAMALLSLAPVLFKRTLRRKLDYLCLDVWRPNYNVMSYDQIVMTMLCSYHYHNIIISFKLSSIIIFISLYMYGAFPSPCNTVTIILPKSGCRQRPVRFTCVWRSGYARLRIRCIAGPDWSIHFT